MSSPSAVTSPPMSTSSSAQRLRLPVSAPTRHGIAKPWAMTRCISASACTPSSSRHIAIGNYLELKEEKKVLQDGTYIQFIRPKGPLEADLCNQLRA
ncbi:hypothetical protein C8F04DRAFT_184132 [Mycena alexandri]|uniref:Uncharacterized protein n=1 Tax=Mycena alexandri TaxID=1745969 RepID=A0AAD6T6V0_9AGAR|nr:hypothetical protein C8F04DRAFT_184132 [Mycena alexandri]